MTQYIIHTCLNREWYVNDYLIPSMTEQGIPQDNIEVWLDKNSDGNLLSCMKCFAEVGKRGSGRWHMQDDVVISHDFKEKTERYDDGIASGFFREEWQDLTPKSGRVPAVYMWQSFQCIRIPDNIAGECAEWFFTDAMHREEYAEKVEKNKYDDYLFQAFIRERYKGLFVMNIAPSIVDHIDFLLGGSVINKWRGYYARGDLWEDDIAFENLKTKLARQ